MFEGFYLSSRVSQKVMTGLFQRLAVKAPKKLLGGRKGQPFQSASTVPTHLNTLSLPPTFYAYILCFSRGLYICSYSGLFSGGRGWESHVISGEPGSAKRQDPQK